MSTYLQLALMNGGGPSSVGIERITNPVVEVSALVFVRQFRHRGARDSCDQPHRFYA